MSEKQDNLAMTHRIARYSELKVLEAQREDIPIEISDIVFARKLLPIVTLHENSDAETPLGRRAPISGAAGMTMTYGVCPPGTGPALHRHIQTYETFTVVRGRFEFSWGEEGENSTVLEELDVISIPPGYCRAFRNIADQEGIVLVVITGGEHDMNDIEFPGATVHQIRRHGPQYLAHFESMGLKFPKVDDA